MTCSHRFKIQVCFLVNKTPRLKVWCPHQRDSTIKNRTDVFSTNCCFFMNCAFQILPTMFCLTKTFFLCPNKVTIFVPKSSNTKQLTAFTTDSLIRLLEASHRELPMQEELPKSEDWEKCVACTKGDNTVGHWVRWCVVPIRALRSLTGDDSILSLAEGSRKSAKHLAIASRVVHQFRLLLREAGAMRHQISAPLIPMNTWIHNLVQRVQPSYAARKDTIVSAHCSADDSLLCCCDKPPLHISCTLAPARVCITLEAVKPIKRLRSSP